MKNVIYPRESLDKLSPRLEKVISILKDFHSKRLLDVGCNNGSFSVLLRNFSDEIYGVDINKKLIESAKQKGIRAYVVDVSKDRLPFEDKFFDIVFAGEIIEHLYDPDHFLDEVYRVLIPQGISIITTPNLASWLNRIITLFGFQPYLSEVSLKYNVGKFKPNVPDVSGHIRCFTLRALKELLELHNFRIKRILGINIGAKDIPFIVNFVDRFFSYIPSLAQYLILVIQKKDKGSYHA